MRDRAAPAGLFSKARLSIRLSRMDSGVLLGAKVAVVDRLLVEAAEEGRVGATRVGVGEGADCIVGVPGVLWR